MIRDFEWQRQVLSILFSCDNVPLVFSDEDSAGETCQASNEESWETRRNKKTIITKSSRQTWNSETKTEELCYMTRTTKRPDNDCSSFFMSHFKRRRREGRQIIIISLLSFSVWDPSLVSTLVRDCLVQTEYFDHGFKTHWMKCLDKKGRQMTSETDQPETDQPETSQVMIMGHESSQFATRDFAN